jgi:hypothetical protein
MACLESAIFSIDLDDDNNMYQEGGGNGPRNPILKAQAAVAIQKELLKIAVNSVNKMNTQMERERGEERERKKKERDRDAKKLLLSGVFKTAVKMKEKSDMELLESLSQKVAKIFTGSLYKTSKKEEEEEKKNKEKEKYAKKFRSHFEQNYKEQKLNYRRLYRYLESDKLLNGLLSNVDNITN